MSWTVPEQIRLTMVHQMEIRREPGLTRSNTRESWCLVRRPDHGELRAVLKCGRCGREGVFVIQDLATTKRLRRGPMARSLASAVVLIGIVAALWIIGFTDGDITLQVLAFPASLLFLPIGVYLLASPSSNIGVRPPESVYFKTDTVREGLSYVTRNSRRGEGLACSGNAKPAA
ncbi:MULTISPECIES: hypothetical protein [unclassified Streptomyces]|uniref:hypothetical protein n=1 Tax=unclassified Streptomyces TaxID=2593676 RepID=UPI00081B568A|nr:MULTISPECIES: hypothetical protein [unclassified Streptomyces]MYQ84831.1 hypothetical protein [Streptomyces sp. SID4936]SCD93596.1 hypothetical protein GA0115234_10548 [Streptomyces sp. DvalAA-43]